MGPATALTSPTRYSDIGTAGVELTTEPAGVDGATALPAPPLLLRRHGTTDSPPIKLTCLPRPELPGPGGTYLAPITLL